MRRRTMSETVTVERRGASAIVSIGSGRRRNALGRAEWEALGAVFAELHADESLRCVVLRGRGDEAFSAGANVAEFSETRSDVAQAEEYGGLLQSTMRAVGECRHPTVAAIHGACVGGGLEVACCCDLRLASRSSRFGIPVSKLGLTMSFAELGGLVRVVGEAAAKEILLEARVFDADKALSFGLVHRVTEDDAIWGEVDRTVERIVAGAPLVHRWHKRFIHRLRDPRPLDEGDVREGFAAFGTADYREGYRAFLAKEKPRFEGK